MADPEDEAEPRSAQGPTSRSARSRQRFDDLLAGDPRRLDRTLTDLALDPGADRGMRTKAVTTLADRANATALDGLRSLLAVEDELVRQRAIERLGKVGAPQDIDRLRRIQAQSRTTLRVLRTANCFLSYRHRLGTYRLDRPKRELPAESAEAVSLRAGAATTKMTNRMALVEPTVRGLSLVLPPARRLVCGLSELALMMNEAIASQGLTTLGERQGVPAVLVMYNEETGAYDPVYYLMTDPIRAGRFSISGVRGSGRVGLHGSGAVEGDSISFEVHATDTPLEHPLTIEGTCDLETAAIRFGVALVETGFSDHQQRRRKQPRAAEPPPVSRASSAREVQQ